MAHLERVCLYSSDGGDRVSSWKAAGFSSWENGHNPKEWSLTPTEAYAWFVCHITPFANCCYEAWIILSASRLSKVVFTAQPGTPRCLFRTRFPLHCIAALLVIGPSPEDSSSSRSDFYPDLHCFIALVATVIDRTMDLELRVPKLWPQASRVCTPVTLLKHKQVQTIW
jgi:hypothetical protein